VSLQLRSKKGAVRAIDALLLRMLRQRAKALRSFQEQRQRGLMNPETFVLKHGRIYAACELPSWTRRGVIKACYKNTFALVRRHRDLVHVEGYALHPEVGSPQLHAWASDGSVAIDRTWWKPQEAAYFGVEIPLSIVRAFVRHTGSPCIFDNEWRLGWPFMTLRRVPTPEEVDEFAARRATAASMTPK
jgi:hypothetical protein